METHTKLQAETQPSSVTRAAFERMSDDAKITLMRAHGAFAESPLQATDARPFVGVMHRRSGAAFGFVRGVFISPSMITPADNGGIGIKDGDLVAIFSVTETEKGLRATNASAFLQPLMRDFAQKLPDDERTPTPYEGARVAVPDATKWRHHECHAFSSPLHVQRKYSPLADHEPVTHIPVVWTGNLLDYVVVQEIVDIEGINHVDFETWERTDKPLIKDGCVACTFRSKSVRATFTDVWFSNPHTENVHSWVTCILPAAAAQALNIPVTVEDACRVFAGEPHELWLWLVAAKVQASDVPMSVRPLIADALGAVWGGEKFPRRFDFPSDGKYEYLILQKDGTPILKARSVE